MLAGVSVTCSELNIVGGGIDAMCAHCTTTTTPCALAVGPLRDALLADRERPFSLSR